MEALDQERQRGQARRLAQALLARPDDVACAACLDALDAYIADQSAGADYAARSPDVARHLDSCVACAESYALLYELRLADPAMAPAAIPAPDLSFLRAGVAGQLRAALGAAVERAGARLRLTLSQALLDLLSPPAAPTMAFRASAEPPAPLFELELDAPDPVVERLRVAAYADALAAERCALRVSLALRGREWPDLAGVPVALALGAERRQAPTDAWGEALFAGVPLAALPGLRVEVEAGLSEIRD